MVTIYRVIRCSDPSWLLFPQNPQAFSLVQFGPTPAGRRQRVFSLRRVPMATESATLMPTGNLAHMQASVICWSILSLPRDCVEMDFPLKSLTIS